jgi:lysozyme
MKMNISNDCLTLIKTFEGFRSAPYRCPAGVPTIGYGSTRYASGAAVKMDDPPVTQLIAESIMMATLKQYEDAVNRYVLVPLKQGQYDSLVDFAYNCGVQNLRTSTLLRKLNARDYTGASGEFGRWNRAGDRVLPGLVRRREAERRLFAEAV